MIGDCEAVCTGVAVRNPFGEAAVELWQRGLFPIPLGGEVGKQPLVANFTKGGRRPRAMIEKFVMQHPSANVGVVTGNGSNLVAIDYDDHELEPVVRERFGDTPLKTRSPSGGGHYWYRHNGERCRNLRTTEGLAIDVKGEGGFIVVPPSFNRRTGLPYRFESGSLDDLTRLPKIRPGALVELRHRNEEAANKIIDNVVRVATVEEGRRNGWLYKRLLPEAKRVATFPDLLARAYELNEQHCKPPLPMDEAEAVAVSVWNITISGNNWTEEQRVILRKSEVDMLAAKPHGAEGLLLLARLMLAHQAEPRKRFAVSPKGMAKAEVLPTWTAERYRKAKAVLESTGHLRLVRKGGRGAGDPHQYELGLPMANAEGLQKPTQYNVTPPAALAPPPRMDMGDLVRDIGTASANDDFGTLVRQERERRGLRQADVAVQAGLGRSTLANIEIGRFRAGPAARQKLAGVLQMAAA